MFYRGKFSKQQKEIDIQTNLSPLFLSGTRYWTVLETFL